MQTITMAELKENIDMFIEIGKNEQINVTNKGEIVFTIVPRKDQLKKEWDSVFGSIPKEIYNENDIERE